jgi:hypothetical protein
MDHFNKLLIFKLFMVQSDSNRLQDEYLEFIHCFNLDLLQITLNYLLKYFKINLIKLIVINELIIALIIFSIVVK